MFLLIILMNLLIVSSATSDGISVESFATFIEMPVEIASVIFSLSYQYPQEL